MVRQTNFLGRERHVGPFSGREFVLKSAIFRLFAQVMGGLRDRLRRGWNRRGDEIRREMERITLTGRERGTLAGLILVSLCVMLGSTIHWSGSRRYVSWKELVPAPLTHAVDLNLATRGELEALPDVGPALAERIVREREERGRFRDVSDLRRVRGIGPKTMERLRPWICVEAHLEQRR